ncbi:MAG: 2,3-bisphosphoglycerate-independent phosphoglycerate mutase [Patescibacteria group bacterium]|nr:2,3-bisphosphoglycerate-independent phosphoglycerate mutase [Patescibacteria group bacterium]
MSSKKSKLPLILVVLDGWGIDKVNRGNAIKLAKTPFINELTQKYPYTTLKAHGKYVGLPKGQVGNSEAGHVNIGAGRIVEQDSVKISKSIANGTFYKNSAFMGAIRHVRKMKSKFHLIGMLSNGQSPHSDPGHLYALLELLKKNKIDNVCLHIFTDGRDSPQYASMSLIEKLEKRLADNEKIATVAGRFYAMDRKKKWERTALVYEALTKGKGRQATSAQEAITEAYNRGESDEFIEPYIIKQPLKINTRIEDKDSVVFFNLRSDRGRQLSKAFVQNDFNKMNPSAFKRGKKFDHLYFTAMTDFGPDLDDILTAYPSIDLKDALPFQLKELSQLYLAETEKYAHVSFFFNGGYSGTVVGEDQLMIASPDVRSYDTTPGMSTDKLSQQVLRNLRLSNKNNWKYDFTLLNIAAPDMVGHTGNLKAAIKTCKIVDKNIKKIVEAYLKINGTVIITADHGNIEKMINLETNEIYTEHTTNPVPFVFVNNSLKDKTLKENGVLGDIAPTVLKVLNIIKPKAMDRKPLF